MATAGRNDRGRLFLQQDGRTCKRLADRKQMPPIVVSNGRSSPSMRNAHWPDFTRAFARVVPSGAVSPSKGVPITNKRGAAGAAPRSFSERKSFAFFNPRELCGREGNHAVQPRAPRGARCFLYSPATGTCARVTIRPRFVLIIH